MKPLDYIDQLNFNTRNFPRYSHIIEAFPPNDTTDVTIKVCRCWQSKKFPYCDGAHKALVEAGDNVGPYIAVLKSKRTKKTNVVNIKQPSNAKNKRYIPSLNTSSKATVLEVQNTLAPGHSQPDYANHRDHNSTFTVTKLQNCQYTYSATAGGGKANLTQDNDSTDDKPGGNNHMTATHPDTGGQTDANGNKWQTGIDASTAKYYSGFTGRHEDDL